MPLGLKALTDKDKKKFLNLNSQITRNNKTKYFGTILFLCYF